MEFKDLRLTTGTLRAFVPAKEYSLERAFYSDLGFKEFYINDTLTIFKIGDFSFYLQNYYHKGWAENFMMFLEVSDVDQWYLHITQLNLEGSFPGIRFIEPVDEDWGRVCRLVTPSGVLWHFGKFRL